MDFMDYETSLKELKKCISQWNRIEKVTITQSLGRILAADVIATQNYPQFQTASMDGYALKFDDLNKQKLKIINQIPAGQNAQNIAINSGECVKTFTGSLICDGADTLLPIENVEVANNEIKIIKKVPKFHACRAVGESYKKGEILLKKGTKLDFSELALLAELGIFHISVFIRPKIGILSTGNEIVDLGESLQNPAQIRSSNHIAILALCQKIGCEGVIFPLVKDDEKVIKDAIFCALQSCDFLVTTGGVSVGDFDFVKKILAKNAKFIVNGANIKPGRHIKIAKINEKFIFALPGFSYSAIVCFTLYVRNAIYWALGLKNDYEIHAILEDNYMRKTQFNEFITCNLKEQNGKIYANFEGKKQGSSAIVTNLCANSALLFCSQNTDEIKKGEIVKIIKMP